MIKAIIFDYDGVIAESVHVKTEAFAEMYKDYGPNVVKEVVHHHEANGGISRYEKIRLYHAKYLGKSLTQDEVQDQATKFSNLVLDKVINAPFIDGILEFLANNCTKYEMYISTGTPSSEIEIILKTKNLKKYFKGVYGSPESKTNHVKKIIDQSGFNPNEIVFIGDATTDRDAARNTGIKFIGRFTTSAAIKKEKYLIRDLNGLQDIIKRL